MVPEATALTSVKPKETNAPRRWKSEYGTEGIKEPTLEAYLCPVCLDLCEDESLDVPSSLHWGFFRDLFQKQCRKKQPAAGVWFSFIQLSLYLVFYCIRRGVKIQLCLECTGGFLGVNSCKRWSELLQRVSCLWRPREVQS